MTAVAVEISPRRPLPDGSPTQSGEPPYFTRPVLAPTLQVTAVTAVADLDELMDSAKCSCNAGDDNPH
ncbi:hypothetical protein ACOKM3_08430 [Streptomyces sp. BH106]|uniref:hypothetical protein n=1 Tax=Streptomyces sp. BH106 TaxID=3410409 RepID=UPI003CF27785